MHQLTQSEFLRYQRHFPVIGVNGQKRLKKARVLCVGAGGLGCPALQYLAAAGVGTIGIVDADTIEVSNLQRQILFYEADLGRSKAEVIRERLISMNPEVVVDVYLQFLSEKNARPIISSYDVILDATDNYQARYLLNDLCREFKKPLVSASIYQFDAQLSVFNYKNGPCYQCLYPEPPPETLTPNCALGGVLGVLPGVAGTLQATEAIKVILELGDTLSGKLLSLDLLSMRFNLFEIKTRDCSYHPRVVWQSELNSMQSNLPTMTPIVLSTLLNSEPIQLIDVRQLYERDICHIGGEHVPLALLETQIVRFSKEKRTIVYCRSGARSATACQLLQNEGFTDVYNLEGGILAWIDTVDRTLMKY